MPVVMDLQAEISLMGAPADAAKLLTAINKLLQSPAPDDDAAARIEEFISSLPLKLKPSMSAVSADIAQDVIDVLDGALWANYWSPDSNERRICLRTLKYLCGLKGILPPSCVLPIPILRSQRKRPNIWGGYGIVYQYQFYGAQVVAIKCPRYDSAASAEVRRAAEMEFFKEAVVWRHLRHPNVVPFLGINKEEDHFGFCLISPWMAPGHLEAYLSKRKQDADRPRLYNIIIDVEHHALLADFGMSKVQYNVNSVRQTTLGNDPPGGSPRWMAPELLDKNLDNCGEEAWQGLITPVIDVYAFAMVVYEIFSGHIPYYKTSDPRVRDKIYKEKARPDRPPNTTDMGLTDAVWDLVTKCWAHKREDRPHMGFVVSQLCDYYNFSVNTDGSIS